MVIISQVILSGDVLWRRWDICMISLLYRYAYRVWTISYSEYELLLAVWSFFIDLYYYRYSHTVVACTTLR
jgi:hypothetical protein